MAQSKGDLTPERQILHLVQWFAEFSDFQRSDFMIDHLLTLYGQFLKNQLLLLEQNGTANGVGGEDGVASTEEQVITGLQALGKSIHRIILVKIDKIYNLSNNFETYRNIWFSSIKWL